MCGAISSKRKQPHTRRAQDVWNALKIDGDTHTDILADNVIIEAHQLCIPKHLFVLINNNRRLMKRQTNWSVIESEFEPFHIFYGDAIRGRGVEHFLKKCHGFL
jgi:hypothetical protein